jgi:hypothetical protein
MHNNNLRLPAPYTAYFYLFPNKDRKIALSKKPHVDIEALYKLEVECTQVEITISCLDRGDFERIVYGHIRRQSNNTHNFSDAVESLFAFTSEENLTVINILIDDE